MRLSEWRAVAPFKNSVSPKVVAVIESAFDVLGAERDPECWVVWADDPAVRYLILAPTPGGLVQVHVRVYVPGEGPRAGGKVVRWNRVQLGELAVEIQGGHRLVTFQVETQVLNGADGAADGIATFAQALMAAIDGRPAPASSVRRARPRSKAGQAKPDARTSAPGKVGPARSRTPAAGPARSTVAKVGAAKAPSSSGRTAASAIPRLAGSKGSTS